MSSAFALTSAMFSVTLVSSQPDCGGDLARLYVEACSSARMPGGARAGTSTCAPSFFSSRGGARLWSRAAGSPPWPGRAAGGQHVPGFDVVVGRPRLGEMNVGL